MTSQPRRDRNGNGRYATRQPAPPHRQAWVPRPAAADLAAPAAGGNSPFHVPPRYGSGGGGGGPVVPQLVHEIQDKLARGAVECMICFDMVRRSAPIWSCSSCYSIFHLNCIKKWARAPTAVDIAVERDCGVNWRCPGCQSVQLGLSKDLRYICFCGKRPDPPFDLYLTPHSCGEPCGKPLDLLRRSYNSGSSSIDDAGGGHRCMHLCVLQCHPGPCPPCKAFAPPRRCCCGKKMITRRCSDSSPEPTCGLRCDKLLNCKRHRCEKGCHGGRCEPCQVLFTAACFCSKKKEVVICGDMAVKGEVNEADGLFSCNLKCERGLSCGNHGCVESCHPGPCGECELLPSKIKTCHCGKTPLMNARKTCLDPIPTCSEACGKTLRCGVHVCKESCHEGDCPPCTILVKQKCRCESSSRTVECHKTVQEDHQFLCDRPCGRKKSCGRHRCSERCCPLSGTNSSAQMSDRWDPHLCQIMCGKKLRCGQHSCETLCHSGHCPPCLETIFSDLSCTCGKTVIPPPSPCGTPPPSCQLPCSVPQPCGHPTTHSCHFGDCPPCSIPIAKECVGGHVVLRNIPCGSKDIRCNQLCGKTRQCGMHACARTCHPSPCDSPMTSTGSSNSKVSCGQVCGAPRRDCRHACISTCHPSSSCPDIRCEFAVTITCSCGRITASVPCDAGGNSTGFHVDTVFEASITQKLPVSLQPVEANEKRVPLGQRKLVCNEECAKVERKRVLADAFDITPPSLDSLHFGEKSSVTEIIWDLLRREPKWVMSIEERLKYLVLGKPKGSSAGAMRVHVFSPVSKDKRDAIRLIAERWKVSIQAAGWEPRRFVVVHATAKSKAPARIIGHKAGVPIIPVQPPLFDQHVDMDPRLVVALFDLPRDADISALVLRFGGECELVWLNDKNAVAVFSDPIRAATALRRLDHGSVYHGAVSVTAEPSTPRAVWGVGLSKDGAGTSSSVNNPWMKAVVHEHDRREDSSRDANWPRGSQSELRDSQWEGKEAPAFCTNSWSVLTSDNSLSSVNPTNLDGNPSSVSGESSQPSAEFFGKKENVEVDDWEEAYT